MIVVNLIGGPLDGEDHVIQDDIWKSGYLRLIQAPPILKWSYKIESVIKPVIEPCMYLTYKRAKYNQGWGCLIQDWDSKFRIVSAACPEYKWIFEGYKW